MPFLDKQTVINHAIATRKQSYHVQAELSNFILSFTYVGGFYTDMTTHPIASQDRDITALGQQDLAAVHPCVVYRFLQEKSPETCLQLLPLLSHEQFVRLFDYDVWQQDRLSPAAAFRWLDLYRRIDNRELLHRFRSLDEEYQLAIMSSLVGLITHEELESLPLPEQDNYATLPCRQLYYTVKSPQVEVREAVAACIETLLTQDLEWTYALLKHAASCLTDEQEMLMLQFRTSRMEEDGYVSFTTSTKIFVPIDLHTCRQRWASNTSSSSSQLATQTEDWFTQVITHSQSRYDEATREQVQLKLLFCSNTLCAATLTEVSDRRGVRQMLEQTRAVMGLALDYLSAGDLACSADILAQEHGYVLFRVGMTLIYQVQEELLATLSRCALPQLDVYVRLYKMRKWQALHDFIDTQWLDVLGYEQVETLKGIFARFPQLISEEPRARFITVTSMYRYRLLKERAQLLAAELEGRQ